MRKWQWILHYPFHALHTSLVTSHLRIIVQWTLTYLTPHISNCLSELCLCGFLINAHHTRAWFWAQKLALKNQSREKVLLQWSLWPPWNTGGRWIQQTQDFDLCMMEAKVQSFASLMASTAEWYLMIHIYSCFIYLAIVWSLSRLDKCKFTIPVIGLSRVWWDLLFRKFVSWR